jgi:hypothetical protein
MSEATEEPMICGNCGGTMTDKDAFSISLGGYSILYWHMEHSGCIASLGERLTAATKRAEQAESERDALRKDAARLDWLESRKSYSISNLGGMACAHLWVTDGEDVRVTKSVTKPTIREAIDAAMEAKV